jgi:hypothetical protein
MNSGNWTTRNSGKKGVAGVQNQLAWWSLTHGFGRRPDILAGFLCCAMSAEVRLMEAGTVPEHPITRHFKVS